MSDIFTKLAGEVGPPRRVRSEGRFCSSAKEGLQRRVRNEGGLVKARKLLRAGGCVEKVVVCIARVLFIREGGLVPVKRYVYQDLSSLLGLGLFEHIVCVVVLGLLLGWVPFTFSCIFKAYQWGQKGGFLLSIFVFLLSILLFLPSIFKACQWPRTGGLVVLLLFFYIGLGW